MSGLKPALFTLRDFVADCDPDGLCIVCKSNGIGKSLVFDRALLPQVKERPEVTQTGVFLLRARALRHVALPTAFSPSAADRSPFVAGMCGSR